MSKIASFYVAVLLASNGVFMLDLGATPMAVMNFCISIYLFRYVFPSRKICPICQKNYRGNISYCRDCGQALQSKTARKLRGKLSEVKNRWENGKT